MDSKDRALLDPDDIGWAPIDLWIPAGVAAQQALKRGGGSPLAIDPTPVGAIGPSVQDQAILVVMRIHLPSQLQLPDVGHAGSRLGVAFTRAERWEKNCGEDRHDRDHHQQFDQGEPAASRSPSSDARRSAASRGPRTGLRMRGSHNDRWLSCGSSRSRARGGVGTTFNILRRSHTLSNRYAAGYAT